MRDTFVDTRHPSAPIRESDGAATWLYWTCGFALYVAAYTGAVVVSFRYRTSVALLSAIANAAPDALAAPIVLRLIVSERVRPFALRVVSLGTAFIAWSTLAAVVGMSAVRAMETGAFRVTLDPRGLAWKSMQAAFVFGSLAGIGVARHQARIARETAERALRAEALRAESRLAILRAQLNPHFVLNVLHTILGLVERDPAVAVEALERLGKILQFALRVQNRGSDRVSLREELAFTLEYLELERLRLGDRLRTEVSVGEGFLSRIVPPFVLQPLVENAVVHAISPRARGGVVAVRASDEEGLLRLDVEDDGSRTGDRSSIAERRGSGVGLQLLRDRLDVLYGGGASLRLETSSLGGVAARLRLPAEPVVHEEAE